MESALAQQAAEHAWREQGKMSVSAEIARNYVELRTLQARTVNAKETVVALA